ncbi:MAG: GNAT family N-acetyltransferase [Planctomycetaceae bacterium]|jgi:amino-acid N-acetyltransferase|nr:GNAT family N-acetyltransferase [Planctomycetaceae bacterium]MBT7919158.1 GNAT family N-acetyltransferase [Planctomycetaceae bacterium]
MSVPFQIRSSQPADQELILDLIKPFVAQQLLIPRTSQEITALLEHGFVAMDGDEIVGFAAIEIYSRKLAEIQCLAVCSRVHGLGIGTQLIAACIDKAKEHQVLEVMAISSSGNFLEQCGFDYSLPGHKRALFYNTGGS